MSKIIEDENEKTNWHCSCGIWNQNDEKCDCGKKEEDEDNVEISIKKSALKKPKRIVPY